MDDDRVWLRCILYVKSNVMLVLRSDLVGERCPEAELTVNGKWQIIMLVVLLKSQGVRSNVVYSSPLDQARSIVVPICQVVLSFLYD